MKTHLPTGLRKALIAAIFAVSAVAYNAQADLVKINNASEGKAETAFLGEDHYSTGYSDLTFRGTNEELASVNHWCHDYNTLTPTTDEPGSDTKITAPVDGDGVFRLYGITVEDKDGDSYNHNHNSTDEFGFSTSCSDGNLNIIDNASVEVTSYVNAEGTINLNNHGMLTVTNGNISAEDGITATGHSVLKADNGDISVSGGNITASDFSRINAENGTVSASGTVTADGTNSSITSVNMKGTNLTADNGGHLKADNMVGNVTTSGAGSEVSATTITGNVTAQNAGKTQADTISGAVTATGADSEVKAATITGNVTAQSAGAVNATTISGDVLADGTSSEVTATNITGNVKAKDAGTVNATTITGSATADNATLTAETITNGAIATNNGILTATNISGGASTTTGGTIQTDKQITGSVSGSNGVIAATAGQGLTITDNLEATGDTLITGAGETITIGTTGNGDITGDSNYIGSSIDHSTVMASNIQVKGDISGDANNLSATGTNLAGSVNTISAKSISGDDNTLRITDHGDLVIKQDISGDSNTLTIDGDGDISVLDDVTGDSNTLTVNGDGSITLSNALEGDGNSLTTKQNGSITTDEITGDGNTLTAEGNGNVTTGDVYGDSNTLETQGAGDIDVLGTLGRIDMVEGSKGAVGNTLKAADGDITIDALADNKDLTIAAAQGAVTVTTTMDAKLYEASISAQDDITIGDPESPQGADLHLTEGTSISSEMGSVIIAQDLYTDTASVSAGKDVVLVSSDVHMLHDTTLNADRNIDIEAQKNELTGTTELKAGKNADITATSSHNLIGGTTSAVSITAKSGSISLDAGTDNELENAELSAAKNVRLEAEGNNLITGGSVTSTGQSIHLTAGDNNSLANTQVKAQKNISLDAEGDNMLTTAKLSAENAIHLTAENNGLKTGTQLMANEGNVSLDATAGDNIVQNQDTVVKSMQGNVIMTATGSNTVSDHAVVNGSRNVRVEGIENKVVGGADVVAGSTVTIEGTTNTITGEFSAVRSAGTGVAEGKDAVTITGATTVSDKAEIFAETGNLTIDGTVDIKDAGTYVNAAMNDVTLKGTDVTVENEAVVRSNRGDVALSADQNNVLNQAVVSAGKDIVLSNTTEVSGNAKLEAKGTIDVTTDSTLHLGAASADALQGKLAGDGTINADKDDLNLSDDDTAFAGTLNMSSGGTLTISAEGVGADATINLTEGSDLLTTAAGASLGKLNADSGSQIAVQNGTVGGTATATDLNMKDGSQLHIDADAAAADCISVTDSVSIADKTVYVDHQDTTIAAIDGDVSHTIIQLEEGAENNGVGENVIYDMNGNQRVLQNKNMSLVSTKDGVQLVISDNFRSVEDTTPNQTAVNNTMKALSAAADHSGSTLADSAAKLDNILDALDNTRSTASVKSALQELSAAGNLAVPNMMLDSTHHHLSALRQHMGTPTCTNTETGSIKRGGNIWAAYMGGHDAINGDSHTGDYTRTHQGALLGTDYSVSCNGTVGISLGYESSTGRLDSVRAEADTIFADLYTTLRTGAYTHRFSAGVALSDFDVTRRVGIAAGGHSYTGMSKGSVDGLSVNLGYELSREVKLSEVSTLTPFAAVDVAFHSLDSLSEDGQTDASVTTDYDDFVQTDVALGATYTRSFRAFSAGDATLNLTAALHAELGEKSPTATNRFAGAGNEWKVRSSERTPLFGEIGASVAVPVYRNTTVIGGGNFEFSSDRTAVGGNVGVNVKF